jgi:hypothetical protein
MDIPTVIVSRIVTLVGSGQAATSSGGGELSQRRPAHPLDGKLPLKQVEHNFPPHIVGIDVQGDLGHSQLILRFRNLLPVQETAPALQLVQELLCFLGTVGGLDVPFEVVAQQSLNRWDLRVIFDGVYEKGAKHPLSFG